MTDTLFLVDPTTENIIGLVERNPLWEAFHTPEAIEMCKAAHDKFNLDLTMELIMKSLVHTGSYLDE